MQCMRNIMANSIFTSKISCFVIRALPVYENCLYFAFWVALVQRRSRQACSHCRISFRTFKPGTDISLLLLILLNFCYLPITYSTDGKLILRSEVVCGKSTLSRFSTLPFDPPLILKQRVILRSGLDSLRLWNKVIWILLWFAIFALWFPTHSLLAAERVLDLER